MTKSISNSVPGIPKKIQQASEETVKVSLLDSGIYKTEMWDCTIPYIIDSSIVYPNMVKKAIEYVETVTDYSFVPRTNEFDYIIFKDSDKCRTGVGKGVGETIIHTSRYCNMYSIVHEIGHILGLSHTMSREDRDNYITIRNENIENDALNQFSKNFLLTLGDFDYSSQMMYDRYAFTKNGNPTIDLKNKLDYKVGGRSGFSENDILNINSRAREKNCPRKSKQAPCKNTDIIFFDGDTINNYTSINGLFYKVSNILYKSYNLYEDTNIVIRKNSKNIWEIIDNNDNIMAYSTHSDLFNTQWNILNINTDKFEIVKDAKLTRSTCPTQDLTDYTEKFNFWAMITSYLLEIIVIFVILVIFVIMIIYRKNIFVLLKIKK
jgi:hypothetical protein